MPEIRGIFKDRELSDKEKKNLSILDTIRKNGPIGRNEISRITDFNIVTVSNYIDHYIKEGLVTEGGYDTSSGGRKPMLVDLNQKAGYFIGVGFDMIDMIGVVIDLRCNILFNIKRKRAAETGRALLHNIIEMVDEIIKQASVPKDMIKGIALAVAGVVDQQNMTIRWPGPLGTKDLVISATIFEALEKQFNIPIIVENDADCAAFGEQWIAIDPTLKSAIYMYSGVSCGIIINGQIYKGASGCAGELGILNQNRLDRYDWKKESYGLGRWDMDLGLIDEVRSQQKKRSDSLIYKLSNNKIDNVTFLTIIEAGFKDDSFAIDLLSEAGENLGKKIAFLINLINPQVVIIGGGIEKAGALLLGPLKKAVKEWAFEEAHRALKIIPAQLSESAVPLGAASVVMQKYFEMI